LGLVLIAWLGTDDLRKGLIAGLMGLMVSLIGMDPVTGSLRYTFGSLYLWDGIDFVVIVIGLFAIGEMINLSLKGTSIADEELVVKGSVLQGIKDVFKRIGMVMRCSVIGVIAGIIPGVGGSVASFLAYGHAASTSKDKDQFGKGAIDGIIGPESANDSKEGGALVPTLAFGVPGSSGMAILMMAMLILGVQPGPNLLKDDMHIFFFIVIALVAGNLIASLFGLMFATKLVVVTKLKASYLVPLVVVCAMVGVFGLNYSMVDVFIATFFGLLGYFMNKLGYSRAIFIIGVVLGTLAETNFRIALRAYGWAFLLRPITLGILIVAVVSLMYPLIKKYRKRSENKEVAQ